MITTQKKFRQIFDNDKKNPWYVHISTLYNFFTCLFRKILSLRVRKFSYLNSAYTDKFFISIMNFAYFTKKTNCSFQEASPWAFCISLKLIFVRNESKYKFFFFYFSLSSVYTLQYFKSVTSAHDNLYSEKM